MDLDISVRRHAAPGVCADGDVHPRLDHAQLLRGVLLRRRGDALHRLPRHRGRRHAVARQGRQTRKFSATAVWTPTRARSRTRTRPTWSRTACSSSRGPLPAAAAPTTSTAPAPSRSTRPSSRRRATAPRSTLPEQDARRWRDHAPRHVPVLEPVPHPAVHEGGPGAFAPSTARPLVAARSTASTTGTTRNTTNRSFENAEDAKTFCQGSLNLERVSGDPLSRLAAPEASTRPSMCSGLLQLPHIRLAEQGGPPSRPSATAQRPGGVWFHVHIPIAARLLIVLAVMAGTPRAPQQPAGSQPARPQPARPVQDRHLARRPRRPGPPRRECASIMGALEKQQMSARQQQALPRRRTASFDVFIFVPSLANGENASREAARRRTRPMSAWSACASRDEHQRGSRDGAVIRTPATAAAPVRGSRSFWCPSRRCSATAAAKARWMEATLRVYASGIGVALAVGRPQRLRHVECAAAGSGWRRRHDLRGRGAQSDVSVESVLGAEAWPPHALRVTHAVARIPGAAPQRAA